MSNQSGIVTAAMSTEAELQVEVLHSVIGRLADISVDSSAKDVFRLALRHLQDALVNTLYRRPPPPTSRLLNLGCGDSLYPGWVNADRFRTGYWIVKFGGVVSGKYRLPDWVLDAAAPWNCPTDHWEGIYTEHMLEHLSYREAVAAMREIYRTLRPGGRVRIILPDLRRYIAFYEGDRSDPEMRARFAFGAEAMSFLTQNFGHVSVWDAPLLEAVLNEIGFTDVAEMSYRRGSDDRLIQDNPNRAWESLYVEARKPDRQVASAPAQRPAEQVCA